MNHLNIEKALDLLKEDGKLSLSLKGFEPRQEQQKMMEAVLTSYNEGQIALIEAQTGTGKSFAYLIPAILWSLQNKERTAISTHTIALQEQLLNKDIPLILKALNVELKAVLVKGMSNYACLRKLEETREGILLLNEEEREEFQKLEAWSATTKEGSRSNLNFALFSFPWEKIAAESDTCTNSKCPHFQECHFFKARKKAQDAQLLIVNHHLLFADLNRREEIDNYEDPAILPAYTRIVMDEAHHIEDIATEYFAKNVNRLNLLRIIGRLSAEKQTDGYGKLSLLKQKIGEYYKNKMFPSEISSILSRLTIDITADKNDLLTHLVQTFDAITEFMAALLEKDSEDKELKLRLHPYHQTHPLWKNSLVLHAEAFIRSVHKYIRSLEAIDQDIVNLSDEKLNELTKSIRHEILALANRLKEAASLLKELILTESKPNKVRWMELQTIGFQDNLHLNDADLDISKACVEFLFSKFAAIILCSATLTSHKNFKFIKSRLGLTEKLLPEKIIKEEIYGSPFDFKKQALFAVPTDLPDPSDKQFIKAAAEHIWHLVKASNGNAFVLFTSYAMLNQCSGLLEKKFVENRYQLFKQGNESRQKLLEKFKKTERSILFGTDSFWEGVDVAGDALRCVIIVKLPFKVPSEPIVQARSEAILAKGGEPFTEYSLPSAIVKFKQGVGRLIRNKSDRGCIICLDSRILKKGYGKQFLDSLPGCQTFFGLCSEVEKEMSLFYKRTHYLVKKSS
ncbi:MAG TPA: helicase C-terminal domain-containing protein [Parachlamydiaceae bacterium]|nr:helicase C-terminal domain-containing protein [Parachlamydiaceae bacterium]